MDFVAQAQTGGVKGINYRNMNIYRFNEIYSEEYVLSQQLKLVSESEIKKFTGPVKTVDVIVPTEAILKENFALARGSAGGNNCDVVKKGTATKRFLLSSVVYDAEQGGVSCDYFDYMKLPYDAGLMLRLKGINDTGRGLKVYLYNRKTTKMDLEELTPTGSFDQAEVIYPKELTGSGYTVNLETRAFGREGSRNTLEEISFWPLPINWIQSVKLGTETDVEYKNSLNIQRVTKKDNWWYEVKVGNGTKNYPGLIALGQGYQSGWKAYWLNTNAWAGLKRTLPMFFGYELNHVKVNGWENGWEINRRFVLDNLDTKNGNTIILVYWPQYLEILGLGLLGLVVVWKGLGLLKWPINKILNLKN
jgi:hypothetical protein